MSQVVGEEELAACLSVSEPVILAGSSTSTIFPGYLIYWAESIWFSNLLAASLECEETSVGLTGQA